jgi:hypothetical protein
MSMTAAGVIRRKSQKLSRFKNCRKSASFRLFGNFLTRRVSALSGTIPLVESQVSELPQPQDGW